MGKKPSRKLESYDLAARVVYLREKRNLTQVELAEKAKLSQSTVAQIETGKKDPSITTLKKLASALDVHIAVLFASDMVHVFDMNRLKQKYKSVDQLNETIYFALGRVTKYAKDIGFLD